MSDFVIIAVIVSFGLFAAVVFFVYAFRDEIHDRILGAALNNLYDEPKALPISEITTHSLIEEVPVVSTSEIETTNPVEDAQSIDAASEIVTNGAEDETQTASAVEPTIISSEDEPEIVSTSEILGITPNDEPEIVGSGVFTMENPPPGWNKDRVSNLYSFASNLTAAWVRSTDGDPEPLRQSIHHCLWHATQLSFGEKVENHLTHLCTIIDSYTADDWNDHDQRRVIEEELASVWAATRYIVRGNEFPFVPEEWQTNS